MLLRCIAYLFSIAIATSTSAAFAQDYPSKIIRMITAAAGAGSDFNARQIAQQIAGPLGQPVIVDNRTSVLAAEAVAKAPADGYTLLVSSDSLWVTSLLRKTSYDPLMDFAQVSLLSREVSIVAVHPSLPTRTIRDLIALAKAKPGQLNYSSTPSGGASHLAGELLKSMAGVDIVRIAYKGGLQAITALISGEAQMSIPSAASAASHVRSGKLRALAVTSLQTSELFPDLPTVTASGIPGYEAISVTGLFAPAKTPAAIVTRLNQEVVRALRGRELKERFLNTGIEAVDSSPDQFAAIVKTSFARLSKVIREADIKSE